MSLNFQAVETLASSSGVKEGTVASRGICEPLPLGVDLQAGVFRFLVEMPIPQKDEEVGARLGKRPVLGKDPATGKNIYGEQSITSNIFGKVSSTPVYIQAPDGGTMEFTSRLQAPVAGATESTETDEE